MPLLRDRIAAVTIGALIDGQRKALRVTGHRVSGHVEKTLKAEPNKCECVIYNLNRDQRGQIEQLRPKAGEALGIPLLIEIGYKTTGLGQIWLGDVRTAWSEHNGADWLTHIEAGDGEKAKGSSVKIAYGPGTSPDVALRAIVRALNIGDGNVAAVAAKLKQTGIANLVPNRLVLTGSAEKSLTNFCASAGLEWSVQDSTVQILDKGGLLSKQAFRLATKGKNGQRGTLVESPSVDPNGVLTAKTLYVPGLRCGSLIEVESSTATGNYRVRKAEWDFDTFEQPWYITAEATRY